MRSVISQNRSMSRAASVLRVIRQMAAVLVDREQYRVKSRMLAYENTGSMVGTSGFWMRRFVNGDDDARLSFPVGLNILAMYERLCDRIETDNHEAAQRIARLRAEIHAAAPRALSEIVAGARGEVAADQEE